MAIDAFGDDVIEIGSDRDGEHSVAVEHERWKQGRQWDGGKWFDCWHGGTGFVFIVGGS